MLSRPVQGFIVGIVSKYFLALAVTLVPAIPPLYSKQWAAENCWHPQYLLNTLFLQCAHCVGMFYWAGRWGLEVVSVSCSASTSTAGSLAGGYTYLEFNWVCSSSKLCVNFWVSSGLMKKLWKGHVHCQSGSPAQLRNWMAYLSSLLRSLHCSFLLASCSK